MIFAIPVIVRVRQVYAGISGREKLAWLPPVQIAVTKVGISVPGIRKVYFLIREQICANQFVKVSYDASSTAVLSLLLITWKEELTRSSRNCEWNFKIFGVGNREENFK